MCVTVFTVLQRGTPETDLAQILALESLSKQTLPPDVLLAGEVWFLKPALSRPNWSHLHFPYLEQDSSVYDLWAAVFDVSSNELIVYVEAGTVVPDKFCEIIWLAAKEKPEDLVLFGRSVKVAMNFPEERGTLNSGRIELCEIGPDYRFRWLAIRSSYLGNLILPGACWGDRWIVSVINRALQNNAVNVADASEIITVQSVVSRVKSESEGSSSEFRRLIRRVPNKIVLDGSSGSEGVQWRVRQ